LLQEDIAKSMEKLLGQMDDPETLASLQAAMQHLGSHREGSEQIAVMAGKAGHDSSSTGSTATSSNEAAAAAAKAPAAAESLYPPLEDQTDVDRTVLKTLEALSKVHFAIRSVSFFNNSRMLFTPQVRAH
jgi:hypothetical protein